MVDKGHDAVPVGVGGPVEQRGDVRPLVPLLGLRANNCLHSGKIGQVLHRPAATKLPDRSKPNRQGFDAVDEV